MLYLSPSKPTAVLLLAVFSNKLVLPTAVLKDPVVNVPKLELPIAVFSFPVVMLAKLDEPSAALLPPDVRSSHDFLPTAVFQLPLV